MAVVVVCATGNYAQTPGATGSLRDIVDTNPAMFVDRITTVGASYFNGARQEASQDLSAALNCIGKNSPMLIFRLEEGMFQLGLGHGDASKNEKGCVHIAQRS